MSDDWLVPTGQPGGRVPVERVVDVAGAEVGIIDASDGHAIDVTSVRPVNTTGVTELAVVHAVPLSRAVIVQL